MRSPMTSRLVSLLALLSLAPPLAAQDTLPLTVCAVFDGLPLPGMAVTAEYPGAGARADAATADDGCTALQVPVVTGLEAVPDERALALQLYPNPTAGGQLAVDVSGDAASAALYDATGRRLATLLRKGEAPGASTHVSFEHLAAGLYFVRLTGKSRTRGAVKAFVHLGGSLELRTRVARFAPASPPPEPQVTYSGKTGEYSIHLDLAADGYAPISADTTFLTGDTLTFALKKVVEVTVVDGSSNDVLTPPAFNTYNDSLVVTALSTDGDTLESRIITDGSFIFVTPREHYVLSIHGPGGVSFVPPFLSSGSSNVGDFVNNNFGFNNIVDKGVLSDFFGAVKSLTPAQNNFIGGVSSGQVDSLSAFINPYVLVFPVSSLEDEVHLNLRGITNARDVMNFYLNSRVYNIGAGASIRFEPYLNSDGTLNDTLTFVYGVHLYPGGVAPPWTSADSSEAMRLTAAWWSIFENRLTNPFVTRVIWGEDWSSYFDLRNHFVAAYDPDLALTIGTFDNTKVVDGVRVLYSFGIINGGRGDLGADFFNDGLQAFTPGTTLQGGLSVTYRDSDGVYQYYLTIVGNTILNINGLFPSGFIISGHEHPPNDWLGKNGVAPNQLR